MDRFKALENTAKLFYKTIHTVIINPSLGRTSGGKLTGTQLACLHYVYRHDEPSVGAIACGLGISSAAAVKLIDRLVRKKLLTREEDPDDRRVLKIIITLRGKEILEEYNSAQNQLFSQIIMKMSKEDVDALERGLTQFLRAALVKPEQIDEVCQRCGWDHFSECPGNMRYLELTGHEKTNT